MLKNHLRAFAPPFKCTKGRIPTKGRNLVITRNWRITGITWISVFKIANFISYILIYIKDPFDLLNTIKLVQLSILIIK